MGKGLAILDVVVTNERTFEFMLVDGKEPATWWGKRIPGKTPGGRP